MQINDLAIYQKIYETRSINRAAQQLGYSQSNITVRLKTLENELQTKLFTRSYQGLTPTRAGDLTYNYAQKVLETTNQFKTSLQRQVNNRNVLISELLFKYLVIEKHAYQLTDYNFEIKKSTAIINSNNSTDQMVITYADFHSPKYRLVETNWLRTAFLSRDGKIQKPFLINSDTNCPFRKKTLSLVNPDDVTEIDSWDSIIDLVKQGQGTALLPQYLTDKNNLKETQEFQSIKLPYRTFILEHEEKS